MGLTIRKFFRQKTEHFLANACPRLFGPLCLPVEARKHAASYHPFKLARGKEPELLGEHRHSLTIGAASRQPRKIAAPERSLCTECLDDSLQWIMEIAERVALRRVARERGDLDGHIGRACQLAHPPRARHC